MPNFAKSSKATVRTTSLEHTAQQIARNDTKAIINTQSITPDILASMEAQGMMNMNAWSPGSPINPTQPIGEPPRQFEYMIGQNIVQRPRSTEAVSFDTMRSIIEMYDVAQMCIEVRQDELRNLEWDIVPIDEDDAKKYESEIKKIRAFFEKPDGYTLFDDFQNKLSYDWLAFDALTIFPHLTKGGQLGALEVIDGTTITPMVDYRGQTPASPAPAFVQWTYGMPWVWLNRDQLIYRPHRLRTNKLYGFTPIEWLLNNINTDIRYQLFFLQYFTDGSVPDSWINAPEGMQDPNQIKKLQDMYDAVVAGDQRQKHRVKWIPAGSKVTPSKDAKFDVLFPQYLLTKTCAAWKVTPAELGFTEKVNKSSGETQENVQYRRSIKPSAMFFASIYTGIIQKYFGLPNLKFKYLNLDEQEDMLLMAQRDEIYIRNGVQSPDEVRAHRLGLDVDSKNPVPRVFITTNAIMTTEDALRQSKAMADQEELGITAAGKQPSDPLDPSPDKQPKKEEKKPNEVSTTLEEEQHAQKSVQDFFVSPAERKMGSIPTPRSKHG